MTKTALACALSVGLHGFLLTQWPSPGGGGPLGHLLEPVQAVYLTAAAAPTISSRAPRMTAPVPMRSSSAVGAARPSERLAARAPVPAPAVTPSPPVTPPRWSPPTPSAPSAPPSARPREEETPPQSPSLLTPEDFAQFRYKQIVRARLQRAILYPTGHAVPGGRVRLRLTITRAGEVASASCTSAESPMFEESVMAGVAAAGPFPAFPADLDAAQETYEFLVAYAPGTSASVSP